MDICFCNMLSQNLRHFSFFPITSDFCNAIHGRTYCSSQPPPPHPPPCTCMCTHTHMHVHTHTHTCMHTKALHFMKFEKDLKENHISLPPVGNCPFKYHLKIFLWPLTIFMTSQRIMDSAVKGDYFLLDSICHYYAVEIILSCMMDWLVTLLPSEVIFFKVLWLGLYFHG